MSKVNKILHGPSSKFDQELTPKTKHKGDAESENATVYVCRYASDNIRHAKNIMYCIIGKSYFSYSLWLSINWHFSQPLISMKYLISPFKDVRWLDGHVCNDELLYFVNILFTLSRLLMLCISNYDGSRNSAQYNKLIYFGSDTLLPLVHNDVDDEKCIFYVLRNIVKRL